MRETAARAPGKIIVSGEHAVVHGCPALAAAANRYAGCRVEPGGDGLRFEFSGMAAPQRYTPDELRQLHQRLEGRHESFRRDEITIADVMPEPFELVPYAFARMAAATDLPLPSGAAVSVRLEAPAGCGMGASAAISLAVLQATAGALGATPDRDELYELALDCERLRHGRPSGADPHTCLHGGAWRFQEGAAEPLALPALPFFLVNSGTPQTSTGECVAAAAPRFEAGGILAEFASVTEEIALALEQSDAAALRAGIRENHRLLTALGVTPERVQRIVGEIEASGGAAKICGAGAVRGDAGGMVLVSADAAPSTLCREYDYELMEVEIDRDGTRLV